jgi:prepilin signal peptidase PulO-like enzyme (type II secretory pathway)
LACFLGFKQQTLHSFYMPMQTLSGDKFDFHFWESEHVEGRTNVWVSPAIPFLTFITIAFFITIFYGDLLTPIYHLLP